MKNKFKGWWAVFGFTFRQSTKRTGFKVVTILLTLAILVGSAVLGVFLTKPEKEDIVKVSPIQKIFILDNSGLEPADYKSLTPLFAEEGYQHITFETVQGDIKDIFQRAATETEFSIVIRIEKAGEGYAIEGILPEHSQISKSDINALIPAFSNGFEINKLLQTGLDEEQLGVILKPVISSYSDIGENGQNFGPIIKMVATMIFGFLLYMMLLTYGQAASKEVSTEKTSKLVETLLTSVHPYALIGGKVVAVCAMGIIQFVLWLAALIGGLRIGNLISNHLYGATGSQADMIFSVIKEQVGKSAFTVPSIILGILAFCIGFFFYIMLSGMTGAMVSKPEDTSTVQGIFTLPIVFSFLAAYFISMLGSEVSQSIIRYVPFTAPFVLPVDILIGSIGLLEGFLATFLLLALTLVVVILSGKIYKGFILYNGQKISFKLIGNMIKGDK